MNPKPCFWLNSDLAPIYRLVLPANYEYEDLDAEMTHVEAVFSKIMEHTPHRRVGLIVNLSALTKSTAKNRSRFAEALRTTGPQLEAQAVAMAVVIASPVIRGAAVAVFWLRSPPWPTKVFATSVEAEDWMKARFLDEGIRL